MIFYLWNTIFSVFIFWIFEFFTRLCTYLFFRERIDATTHTTICISMRASMYTDQIRTLITIINITSGAHIIPKRP